jgi:hypothetical protein
MKTLIITVAMFFISTLSFSQDVSIDKQIDLKKSEIYYAIQNDACCEDIEVMEIELSRLEDVLTLPCLDTKPATAVDTYSKLTTDTLSYIFAKN